MARKGKPFDGEKSGANTGVSESKRPTATLELEATEIKDEETEAGSAKSAQMDSTVTTGESYEGAPLIDHEDVSGSSMDQDDMMDPAQSGQNYEEDSHAFWQGQSPISHLAAGLLGGLIAIVIGLIWLTGDVKNGTNEANRRLKERLTQIERNVGKLTSEQSALNKQFDATAKMLADFTDKQEGLVKRFETARKAETTAAAKSGDRLNKLEQSLQELVTMANTGGGNKFAEAAAITARMKDAEARLGDKLQSSTQTLKGDIENLLQEQGRSISVKMQKEFESVRGDTEGLARDVRRFQTDIKLLNQALKTVEEDITNIRAGAVKTGDMTGQVKPLNEKIALLENHVSILLEQKDKKQGDAKQTALAIAIANLKRAIDRGEPYEPELQSIEKLSPIKLQLSGLKTHSVDGIATVSSLERSFKDVIRSVLDADAANKNGSLVDKFLSNARAVVRVRRTGEIKGTDTEAIVARMEMRMKSGNLKGAVEEGASLKGPASEAVQVWLNKARARLRVEKALQRAEMDLLAALAGKDTGDKRGVRK